MATKKSVPVHTPWLGGHLNGNDVQLVQRLKQLPTEDLVQVIDRTVREQRSVPLSVHVHGYIQWQRKQPGFEGPVAAPPNTARQSYLRTHSDGLISDAASLPLVLNGTGLAGFLAADAEFLTETSSNRNVVVMFSAVQIPENRGHPIPKIHLIVNHDRPGKLFDFRPYAVKHIHGIKRKVWKMHIPPETFAHIMTEVTKHCFLLFWDAKSDRQAVENTFLRAIPPQDPQPVLHWMLDMQAPIQKLLSPYAGEAAARSQMGLQTALTALLNYADQVKDVLEPPMKSAVASLLNEIRVSGVDGQKNSLLDATGVAYLYNVFAEKLPSLSVLQSIQFPGK